MPTTQKITSYSDRFARVADGSKRLPPTSELEDLASNCDDWQGMANELETAAADFAANVEMLADTDTPKDEREDLRTNLRAAADRLSTVFEELAHYTEGLL